MEKEDEDEKKWKYKRIENDWSITTDLGRG